MAVPHSARAVMRQLVGVYTDILTRGDGFLDDTAHAYPFDPYTRPGVVRCPDVVVHNRVW